MHERMMKRKHVQSVHLIALRDHIIAKSMVAICQYIILWVFTTSWFFQVLQFFHCKKGTCSQMLFRVRNFWSSENLKCDNVILCMHAYVYNERKQMYVHRNIDVWKECEDEIFCKGSWTQDFPQCKFAVQES